MLRLPLFSVVVLRWIKPRLVPVLLALAFAFGLSVVSDARADAPVTWWWWRDVDGGKSYNTTADYRATKDQVCAEYVPRSMTDRGITTWQITATSVGTTGCNYNFKNTTNGQTGTVSNSGAFFNVSWCANNSAPDTTKPLANQCGAAPPNCSDASLLNKYRGAGVTGPVAGVEAPSLICVQGCGYVPGSVMTVMQGTYSGRLGAATGNACTTGANYDIIDTTMYDGSNDKPPSPLTCADQGKVYGTVNGVGGCYGAGAIPGSSVTHSDSSTSTKTDASGVQAKPETTNTTTTITNNNGVTNITQVTTNPDGTKTSTTSTKGAFCAKNPNDAACGDVNSVSGGETCNAPPVCNGDALQCAMLQQQYKTRCELQKSDEVADFGHALASGQDPDAGNLPTPGKAPEVNLKDTYSGLDNMGVVAACMPDVRINIPGMVWLAPTTLTISTQPLCEHGKLLGYLNIIATCLVCAYMLKGSF